ncbi:NAD(P)/FAD-dependent oxidoreductase [Conexibacter sp. DBS9H8]|uniref:NAD(P)/FAD-dependent oxidoreductase n=1 Tax=Conexibacter sp. DBS9H8 TaxID=2937801 RepID=UPI00200BE311|nr:NAD(P)/FAD-dependent oxidoreductase [Conexibacter sp. DBS9H8]
MASKVLILGGGFGGFYTARKLEKHAPADTTITLVNNTNYLTYAPLMPGVAAGTLDPRHIVMPLREHFRRTQLRVGWVTSADPAAQQVTVEMVSGHEHTFDYDHLVIALGSVSRTFPVPGLAEHGVGFKTIEEATALRNRIIHSMELAEGLDDPFERRSYLSFVFVGGGYAGLEGIAELLDFADDVLKLYPRCKQTGVKFTLVDIMPRVMPEIQAPLSEWAMNLLRKRGMEFKLETSVKEVHEDHVILSTDEVLPTRTLVWTAGVKASPVAASLGVPLDRGRIITNPALQVDGFTNVWAVGDVAAVPNPAMPGMPCPPTAQHAIRQGNLLGRNIASALKGGEVRPFTFKTLGSFADLGRHKAVANLMGIKVKGFLAWVIARTYHLAWMPGWDRRIRLLTDWTVGALFPRDIAEMTRIGHIPPLDQPILPPAPAKRELPAVTEVPGAPESRSGTTVA